RPHRGILWRAAAAHARTDRNTSRLRNCSGAHGGGRVLLTLPGPAGQRNGRSGKGPHRTGGGLRPSPTHYRKSEPLMALPRQPSAEVEASLVVINPSGNRTRVRIDPIPYTIGRQADNQLVLRDNRASRSHARIVRENGAYFVEDLNSRHGVYVNSERVTRRQLANSDRIDFGFQDAYKLVFTLEEDEIHRMLEQIST